MSSLPTRTDISGTPSNATAKTALSALYDFIAQRFAAGTTGAGTATDAELSDSRVSAGAGKMQHVQDFRLTLTTAVPVTTADVTGAGTVYACPYKGNEIALYTGSAWKVHTSVQFSLALSALTSGRPYDVFCYSNSGTPTLEFLAWTSDTARATALAYQDGVLVKSGDATRRYLGTFYTTGVATTADSLTSRYLWNYYHRVMRPMRRLEGGTWSYSTATIRAANGAAANKLEMVRGLDEDAASARIMVAAQNDTAAGGGSVGVGLDTATSFSSGGLHPSAGQQVAGGVGRVLCVAQWDGHPGLGRHYLSWNEVGNAVGTQSWFGTETNSQGGITGSVMA